MDINVLFRYLGMQGYVEICFLAWILRLKTSISYQMNE